MYTIRKNHMDIEIVTILVYAENRNTLWEYRNLIQKIEGMVPYTLNLSLTARYDTVLDILKFEKNVLDLYIIDTSFGKETDRFLERQIWRKYPNCHGVCRKTIGYAYSGRTKDGIRHVMRTNYKEKGLEQLLLQVLEKIHEEQHEEMWEGGRENWRVENTNKNVNIGCRESL